MTLDEVLLKRIGQEPQKAEAAESQSLFEGRVDKDTPLNLERSTYGSNVRLVTNPRRVIPMEEYLREAEGASVGLNGAIKGATDYISTDRGIYFNFNNSDDVNVLATRSTAAQVLVSIRQGMMDGIDKNLLPLDVYVDDASPDTALAVWLLDNHEIFSGKRAQSRIVSLVHCIDMLESTENAFPFDPERPLMREIAWIFNPYQEARKSGKLEGMASAELTALLQEVGDRISAYADGKSGSRALDTRYDLISRGAEGDWAMVEEVGAHARTGMFQDGIHAFVVVRGNEDDSYSYDIGKMSAYERFPIEDLIHVLNQKEGMNGGSEYAWRQARGDGTRGLAFNSTLHPAQVTEAIDSFHTMARPFLFTEYPRELDTESLPKGMQVRSLGEGMTLIAASGTVMSMEEAKENLPGYSLALDGFVNEAPSVEFLKKGPVVNLNHHEGVDRLSTRSTCGQIYVGLKQGLAEAFTAPGSKPTFNVFVNDCDQDVCLSVWLLKNQNMIRSLKPEQQTRLMTLVYAEDLLDVTAGAYPFPPNSSLMKEVSWIFEPYNDQRLSLNRGTPEENAQQHLDVIEQVNSRITRYVLGAGEKTSVSDTVQVLHEGQGWKMIHEPEVGGRTHLFAEGTRAFVALLNNGENGQYRYSIGKMSPYIPFPIEKIYKALNEAEGISTPRRGWGGSDTIGGSPREMGSKLKPEEVAQIVDAVIEREKERKPRAVKPKRRLFVPGEMETKDYTTTS